MKRFLYQIGLMLVLVAAFCIFLVRVFSVTVITVAAIGTILAFYGSSMALSRKCARKARELHNGVCAYAATVGEMMRLVLGISSPFYFLLLLLALFPIRHYSVGFYFFFPAMVMLDSLLGIVSNYFYALGLSRKIFWGYQMLIQLGIIVLARAGALQLFNRFY